MLGVTTIAAEKPKTLGISFLKANLAIAVYKLKNKITHKKTTKTILAALRIILIAFLGERVIFAAL
jgi:hypothetical protein